MQTEHVILLNAQGVPTGTLEKYAAHTADTLLHLAFSSWLFNAKGGNDSNLLIVFYVQIMPDDFVMQLHRF